MIITKEIAKNILEKRTVVDLAGVYETKHRVSSQVFAWEGTGEAYRIVNTTLVSRYLANEAIDLFKAGEYEKSTNKNLSFRADLNLASKLDSSILSQVLIEEVGLSSGENALMIRKITPKEASKGSSILLDETAEVESVVLETELEVA
jgi:hypothetical protein